MTISQEMGCTGVESSECSCLVEDLFSWAMYAFEIRNSVSDY